MIEHHSTYGDDDEIGPLEVVGMACFLVGILAATWFVLTVF